MNDASFFEEAIRADAERIKRRLPKNVKKVFYFGDSGEGFIEGWAYEVTGPYRDLDQAFSIFKIGENFYLKISSFEWIIRYQRDMPKDRQQFNLAITEKGVVVKHPPFQTVKEAYEFSLQHTGVVELLGM